VRLEVLRKLKKFNYLNGARTRDLPACNVVPQPTTLPPAPSNDEKRMESAEGKHDKLSIGKVNG
jgi:hypothetical protein